MTELPSRVPQHDKLPVVLAAMTVKAIHHLAQVTVRATRVRAKDFARSTKLALPSKQV